MRLRFPIISFCLEFFGGWLLKTCYDGIKEGEFFRITRCYSQMFCGVLQLDSTHLAVAAAAEDRQADSTTDDSRALAVDTAL